MKKFTRKEVAQHNQDNDLWVIINNKVYDLTKFSKIHPGGKGNNNYIIRYKEF